MATPKRRTEAISLRYYTIDDLRHLLETRPRLELDPEAAAKIEAGARYVQEKAEQDVYIYGVNTGFGSLCETRVRPDEVELLQFNHIVSHAVGVGEYATEEVSRLSMLVKLLTFRAGHSGITVETVERMLDLWNRDTIPAIPRKGTVGASGDLAPLAHMALPLLGMGKVYRGGKVIDAAQALEEDGLRPVRLKAKEGLALTNGVQYINAIAAHCLVQIGELVKCADLIASLSLQAFSCSRTFYQALYNQTSLHQERHAVAANLRACLEGSNHFELPTCNRSKQDPYSFRCIPQVHGAIRQAYEFARGVVERECNGVSDNPLFFPEQDEVLFGGNLHGESTAMGLDFLAIAVSELANISERRTYQLLSGQRGLPSFLVARPGLNTGYMMPQYTSAALVNENKVLSTPASVDTIPTSLLQEDHVSMGGTSAFKLCQIIENCEYVLAVELLTAAQAVHFVEGLRLSGPTSELFDELRRSVTFLDKDRVMNEDIEEARRLVRERRRDWLARAGLN